MKPARARRLLRLLFGSMLVTAALVTAGGRMGLLSGKPPTADEIGVVDGRLRPVRTERMNAVSSFATTDYHRIAPLSVDGDPAGTFARLRTLVDSYPGARIVREAPGYMQAEFTTRMLRFVDDVEFLLDKQAGLIHVRSASRLGRHDFGANRKRIEAIRERLRAARDAGQRTHRLNTGVSRMTQQTLPSGLIIEDVVVGSGDEAVTGRQVQVHYTGWLYQNGTVGAKFDSSKDRGDPFVFPLGAGYVIRGWDEGVAGMRVGGTRKLIIPPELGYGARGAGGVIPPNATLLFEVDLLGL